MKYCKDCELFECVNRTPLGGCAFDEIASPVAYSALSKEAVIEQSWQSFRREAAKLAMAQMIGMGRDDGYKYSPEQIAEYAVVYADALIKQLQEDEK